ncbi:MAG: hypothetical protein NW205_02085 [Hyphomicrobiaceae bacterium]|nr:hypothetical protein [Hyphomicrobiaceae bacterium]
MRGVLLAIAAAAAIAVWTNAARSEVIVQEATPAVVASPQAADPAPICAA